MFYLIAAPVFTLLTFDFNMVKKFSDVWWIVRIPGYRKERIAVTRAYLLLSSDTEHLSLGNIILVVPTRDKS